MLLSASEQRAHQPMDAGQLPRPQLIRSPPTPAPFPANFNHVTICLCTATMGTPSSGPCPALPTLVSSTSTYVTAAPPPGPVTQCRSMLCPMPSTSLHQGRDCAIHMCSSRRRLVGTLHPLQCKASRASLRLAQLGVRHPRGICEAMQRSMHATLKRTNATSDLVQYCSHRGQRTCWCAALPAHRPHSNGSWGQAPAGVHGRRSQMAEPGGKPDTCTCKLSCRQCIAGVASRLPSGTQSQSTLSTHERSALSPPPDPSHRAIKGPGAVLVQRRDVQRARHAL